MAVPDKKEIDQMLVRAWDTNKRGYPLEAIEIYNKVLELDPNYAKVYSWRATAYIGLKDYEQAIKDCNTTIE
ncbi:MAG: tetratricopeptide repeat protein, partial [Selenomonadaceae bacterium]|nr:tetratricopeptide repeat protein [Selenomonadaceae bacterium]